MRAAGISGLLSRKRRRTTVRLPGVRVAPDLLERDFSPTGPDQTWSADITYISTWEGFLYLAHVQDIRRYTSYKRRLQRRLAASERSTRTSACPSPETAQGTGAKHQLHARAAQRGARRSERVRTRGRIDRHRTGRHHRGDRPGRGPRPTRGGVQRNARPGVPPGRPRNGDHHRPRRDRTRSTRPPRTTSSWTPHSRPRRGHSFAAVAKARRRVPCLPNRATILWPHLERRRTSWPHSKVGSAPPDAGSAATSICAHRAGHTSRKP
jgi:hypothetical protein